MGHRLLLVARELGSLSTVIVLGCSLAFADAVADREKLLADLDATQKTELAGLKDELKKQKEVASLNGQKVEKLEQRLARARTTSQANTIRREGGKLLDVKKKADRRVEEIEEKLKQLPHEHEQARYRLILQHPLPGDLKYVEDGGVIYPPKEYAALEQLRQQNGQFEVVADRYVQRLIADGVVEQASRTRVQPFQLANGPPNPNSMMVFYQCRYVSKGGFVNDREGHVVVDRDRRGFWYVSAITQLNGIEF